MTLNLHNKALDEDVVGRLASAGIGPTPSIAYWKRSPTAAHNNGIFVGKVFDTYLGAAQLEVEVAPTPKSILRNTQLPPNLNGHLTPVHISERGAP